jgi:hypothetical protein
MEKQNIKKLMIGCVIIIITLHCLIFIRTTSAPTGEISLVCAKSCQNKMGIGDDLISSTGLSKGYCECNYYKIIEGDIIKSNIIIKLSDGEIKATNYYDVIVVSLIISLAIFFLGGVIKWMSQTNQ